jgi:hypothetical protein
VHHARDAVLGPSVKRSASRHSRVKDSGHGEIHTSANAAEEKYIAE